MQNSLIRQLIAVTLAMTIALHLFTDLAILISFKINQDYIAEFLCIEKEIPESTCHGCCQLKKKLEKHDEQQQEAPESQSQKHQINFYSEGNSISLIPFQGTRQVKYSYKKCSGNLFPFDIFRPPKLA